MADFDWLSAGATVLGGLLGGSEDAPSQTSTSRIDPRMDPYLYGNSNITGIIPQAYNLYNQNPSGMNQQMADGLNRQWNTYSDPATAQGYTNMQSLGASLMGAPISGNPFSDGRIALASGTGAGRVGQSSFGQQTYNNPATQLGMSPFSVVQPPKAPAYISGGLLGSLPAPGTSLGAVGLAQADGQGAGPGGVGTGSTTGGGYNTGNDAQQGTNDTSKATMQAQDFAMAHAPGLLGSVVAGPIAGMMAQRFADWAFKPTTYNVPADQMTTTAMPAAYSGMTGWSGQPGDYNGLGGFSSDPQGDHDNSPGQSGSSGGMGGGDAGRGSQSSNGGQNGGTSGGW